MTIAELFVKLGFQLEGDEELDKTIGGLEKAATNAGKAALGIDLVSGSMIALVTTAVNAAVAFSKFALATGLSTTELQQWEHTAALGNVSAQELQQSVKGIQAVSAQIALGYGNTSPWILLGINPHQDPFSILRQLHEALQNITPERLGMARVIAQQAGISENMFQLLRQKNLPIDALKEMFILTADNQRELMRLNIQWQNLTDTSERLKDKFAAALAPALEVLVGWLQKGVDWLGKFVQWLDSGSVAADLVKVALSTLAGALVILSAAITLITGALAAATAAMIALEFATPIAGFVALTAAVLGTIAAITKLVSIYDEWKRAERVASGDLSAQLVDPETRRAAKDWQRLHAGDTGALTDLLSRPVTRDGASGATIQQTNHIEINGAGDPAAVAGAVSDNLKKQLAHATYTGEALSR